MNIFVDRFIQDVAPVTVIESRRAWRTNASGKRLQLLMRWNAT